jgi:signal transduction histidine kinase
VNTVISGKQTRMSDAVEAAIFRVAQESITNIVRHADAKNVHIEMEFGTEQFALHVRDDGCGFDTAQMRTTRNSKRGLGLLGMKERMELLGGSLSIESCPGKGTCTKAVIPAR